MLSARHCQRRARPPNGKVLHRIWCSKIVAHEPPETAVGDCEVLEVPVVPVEPVVAVVPVVPVEPEVAVVPVVPELELDELLLLVEALALVVLVAAWATNEVITPAIATLPSTASEVVALMMAVPLRRECMSAP